MTDDLEKAVSLLRTLSGLHDEEVYDRLVADGVERQRAARLVEFLPIVYSRLILRNSGARFSTTFRRTAPDGEAHEQPFTAEPVWNAAVAFAYDEAERGTSSRDLLLIAARSSEFDAANKLLNAGSKLANVDFTSPLLTWPENGPIPSRPAPTPRRDLQ